MEGSYVGEALEVHTSIVAHNLLVNVRLDASVDISEDFLLGRLDRPGNSDWTSRILQSVAAAFLFLIFLPISLVFALYFLLIRRLSYASFEAVNIPVDEKSSLSLRTYRLPCVGSDAWSVHRAAGWDAFGRQFLPGLLSVIRGQLSLVGMPPRTIAQTEALPADWRAIYLRGKAGLISEAATASTEASDEIQLYLADAYYSVRRGWSYDFLLTGRYFARLLWPKRTLKSSLGSDSLTLDNDRESLKIK
jgi:lipopolysaccharide/colanic/teichoic acid biosynthesis glycosyltransferase